MLAQREREQVVIPLIQDREARRKVQQESLARSHCDQCTPRRRF